MDKNVLGQTVQWGAMRDLLISYIAVCLETIYTGVVMDPMSLIFCHTRVVLCQGGT